MAQQQSNVMRRYVDEHSGRDLLFGSVLWIFSLLNAYQFFGDGLSIGIGVHENQLRGILGFMQALKTFLNVGNNERDTKGISGALLTDEPTGNSSLLVTAPVERPRSSVYSLLAISQR